MVQCQCRDILFYGPMESRLSVQTVDHWYVRYQPFSTTLRYNQSVQPFSTTLRHQPLRQDLAQNHGYARLCQGTQTGPALVPTLPRVSHCRDKLVWVTTWISILEKAGKSGFAFNIFWTFLSILRVFKSRNDSFRGSL